MARQGIWQKKIRIFLPDILGPALDAINSFIQIREERIYAMIAKGRVILSVGDITLNTRVTFINNLPLLIYEKS